jgi:hypothetical protein
MARSHRDLWLWLGGTAAAAVGAVCLGVALNADQTHAHYALWTGNLMIAVYVAFGFALVCFVCAAFDVPIPLGRSRRKDDLVQPLPPAPVQPTSSPVGAGPSQPVTGSWLRSVTQDQASAGRTFANATPADLVEPFETLNTIQAAKLVQPYLGQWLRVEDSLNDVSDWNKSAMASFKRTSKKPWVFMSFKDKVVVDQRLSVLKRGTKIIVIGKIDKIEAHVVYLEDCELESIARR